MTLLWAFLRARLQERRSKNAEIGQAGNVHHRLPGANGHEEEFQWRGDVPLDGDGRVLLAGLLHAYPGALNPQPKTLTLILDAVGELQRHGVLRLAWDGALHLFITEHGAAVLDREEADLSPGDGERVTRLRLEFAALSDVDLIAKHYGEAIAAYAANLDYSATVMIGVCYEAGLLLMAKEISALKARSRTSVVGLNRNHEAAISKLDANDYVPASSLEGMVYDVLCAIGQGLGDDLEWVKTCLRPTCHFVRSLRNSAGHPTGKAVPRDDIAAHILMLPAFLRKVRSVNVTVAAQG